ncbi:MAG TPA: biotin/lipoyl-containing protein [Candidatus Acidoferrales bacterium]|jgi:acetyl-CoA carboxylase biotin carboxyl carrier protein|nr:biotin/lipoyl-containing protein [Candidatus Acidoferrales bacterium]
MTLTAKDVAEIMRLLEQSSFDNLSLEIDGVKLNLQRGSAAPVRQPAAPASSLETQPVEPAPPRVKPPSEPGLAEVASPLLGIFYRAPKPGEPPFVEVGSRIEEDTVIGIIEVMKLMNSVRAGVKGEVVEILAENAALVEYDQILMRLRPGA